MDDTIWHTSRGQEGDNRQRVAAVCESCGEPSTHEFIRRRSNGQSTRFRSCDRCANFESAPFFRHGAIRISA